MLHRQRILLHMLSAAGRPVSPLELTKWSFLLKKEATSSGGSAFYDFLPYHYGPFSFALFQELDKLESMNYVRSEDGWISLGDAKLRERVDVSVAENAEDIVKKFSSFSRDRLINYVYEGHPSYTVNSEIYRLRERTISTPKVFTAGYEGRSVDAFLNILITSGVRRLIDVRMNPVARRYGFHKSTLNRLCNKLSINYTHVPELGISSEKRQSLNTQLDYDKLFDDYEKNTLRDEVEAIGDVVESIKEQPSVLVCMEADPICCHRSRLAQKVSRTSKLPVRHLGVTDAR